MYSRSTGTRSDTAVVVIQDDNDAASVASTAATTTATDAVPPLTRETSTDSSGASSADTDMASSILGDGYMLESEDGVLTVPFRYQEDADLLCPFQILDCDQVFADIIHFKMHVFSHFRGHELPTFATCFLCDNKYVSHPEDDDPALAWNTMLSHMVHDHFRQGQHLATVRTDFGLMKWMYNRRIINDQQFKRTQLIPYQTVLPGAAGPTRRQIVNVAELPRAPSASPPAAIRAHLALSMGYQNEPYTMNAGRRQERRRRDATRTIVRAHSYV
ncbi:uncharacterized protein Z520_09608 [Fonsecaea multimorphosa CBS 102226]|uniref:Uncharacterized protein n=1 Tax=Fonsecaea multimorphosa CBS 102226 TaxID=1442371 RepID=A0A0D2JMM8_9EURO|nr:uncharacterized protein Z520_09608 [Fonsecaea multimorphosa CBS 102226]KIX94562.1 hypothetical protein Z520_09608 [Fonsecaea multimorphosa CBS 102226]OAL20272.1 hypothetical protein AYO22_08984 [Fonsecaea multimorphosa]